MLGIICVIFFLSCWCCTCYCFVRKSSECYVLKSKLQYNRKKFKNSDECLVTNNENDGSGSTSGNHPSNSTLVNTVANTSDGASGSTADEVEKGRVKDIMRRWNLKQSDGITTKTVNAQGSDGTRVRQRSVTPERQDATVTWI